MSNAMAVPLSAMNISPRERSYVADAVESGTLAGTGDYVTRFEQAIARTLGVTDVVAVNSGTSALELALLALGVKQGDEVIVPALTFAAPAAAVRSVGAVPVFADVTSESWTLDPRAVKVLITPRTRLMITVDLLGHPCDYAALSEIGIPILEDAAQAHGALCRGRKVGTFGQAAAFSFNARKTISTGGGGCVATSSAAIGDAVRVLNSHGARPETPDWPEVVGHNRRMNSLTAAFGLAQVERWDELVASRNAVSAAYDSAFSGLDLGRRPVASWATESTWLHVVTTGRRDEVVAACRAAGVAAKPAWAAVPDTPAFAPWRNGDFPVARQISATALFLPTWHGMDSEVIARVAAAISRGLSGL